MSEPKRKETLFDLLFRESDESAARLHDAQFRRMESALEKMPARPRQSFLMIEWEGTSLAEASQVMGCSEASVRRHLSAARTRLTDELFPKQKPSATDLEVKQVVAQIKSLTPDLLEHLRQHTNDLQNLDPNVFEHLIAEFFASWNFDHVAVVGRNRWTGADVVAMQKAIGAGPPIRYFIEAKRRRDAIGIEVVEKVYGAFLAERPRYGWHVAMIVTATRCAEFARYSKPYLRSIGVELRDADDLHQWLRDYRPSPSGLWLRSSSDGPAIQIYETDAT